MSCISSVGGSGTAGGGEPDCDRPLESVEAGGRRPRDGLMTGGGEEYLEWVEAGGRRDGDPREGPAAGREVRPREGLENGSGVPGGEEEYSEIGGSGTAGGGEPECDRTLESVEAGGRRDPRPREGLETGSGVPGGEEEYSEIGGSGTAGGGEPDCDRPLESVEAGGRRPRDGLVTGGEEYLEWAEAGGRRDGDP